MIARFGKIVVCCMRGEQITAASAGNVVDGGDGAGRDVCFAAAPCRESRYARSYSHTKQAAKHPCTQKWDSGAGAAGYCSSQPEQFGCARRRCCERAERADRLMPGRPGSGAAASLLSQRGGACIADRA
jgi:hypothetical protein